MKRNIKKILTLLITLALIQLLFVFLNNATFLPSPLDVFKALIEQIQQAEIFSDIIVSLMRVLAGYFMAAIIAIPLGILCGYSRPLNDVIEVFVDFLRPIPPIAWIPVAIIIFGLGNPSSYFIVFLGAFFPIFSNTYFGAASLPVIYKNVAESFEIKRSVYILKIIFYYALPYIFNGLKIGIGMAWMSLIAAELIGAQSGLGYFIQMSRLLLRLDNVVLGMIIIGFIGFLLVESLRILENIFLPWLRKKS